MVGMVGVLLQHSSDDELARVLDQPKYKPLGAISVTSRVIPYKTALRMGSRKKSTKVDDSNLEILPGGKPRGHVLVIILVRSAQLIIIL